MTLASFKKQLLFTSISSTWHHHLTEGVKVLIKGVLEVSQTIPK